MERLLNRICKHTLKIEILLGESCISVNTNRSAHKGWSQNNLFARDLKFIDFMFPPFIPYIIQI